MIRLTFVIAGNLEGAPPPEVYRGAAKRFAITYLANPAGEDHQLHLINTNDGLTDDIREFFRGIPHVVLNYNGGGWDIGAHQHAAATFAAEDWVMPFSSWASFRKAGWLKAFADAREQHGDALYGSTASLETSRHIRGTGFLVRAEHFHRYPRIAANKQETWDFESGPESLTKRMIASGRGAYLVAPSGVYAAEEFRRPANGFRAGDQSDIWTFDKHTDIYDRETPAERARLRRRSDGVE